MELVRPGGCFGGGSFFGSGFGGGGFGGGGFGSGGFGSGGFGGGFGSGGFGSGSFGSGGFGGGSFGSGSFGSGSFGSGSFGSGSFGSGSFGSGGFGSGSFGSGSFGGGSFGSGGFGSGSFGSGSFGGGSFGSGGFGSGGFGSGGFGGGSFGSGSFGSGGFGSGGFGSGNGCQVNAVRDRGRGFRSGERCGLFLARGLPRSEGLGILGRMPGRRAGPQAVEQPLDSRRIGFVAARERHARLDPADQIPQAADRVGQNRHRRIGQRRLGVLQSEQALLERPGGLGDQRKSAGSMDPAQRVARAHHPRGHAVPRIELHRLEFGIERREMRIGLVAENPVERRRQRDPADRDLLRHRFCRSGGRKRLPA